MTETKRSVDEDADEISNSVATDISTCATQASNESLSTESDVFNKYKSNASIFTNLEVKSEKAEESQFLTTPVKTDAPSPAEESKECLFKEKAFLYKFTTEWVGLGEGTVVVLEDEQRRLVFSRVGLNTSALNFWINFDLKAEATGKVVRFLSPELKDDKVTFVLYAVRLRDENSANVLLDLIGEASQAEDEL